MKRLLDYYLNEWKKDDYRKPLLLRGARQVGKTYAVRQLGLTYDNFVEINLEQLPGVQAFFKKDLHPERIVQELSLYLDRSINPKDTLLFIDEIQVVPEAILALRYFYEIMPELHVIAAGSLLDFAIEKVGIPVGRVQSLYVYPLSFIEFLVAMGHSLLAAEIIDHDLKSPMSEPIHHKALDLLGVYIAIGGMPEAVACWLQRKDFFACSPLAHSLADTYRQDFGKYARVHQIPYVELLFDNIPLQQGQKFKYSAIDGDYRKRELAPALDLLVTAGIVHKVHHSAGQGVPLGAQIDPQDFKANFVDIGVSQVVMGLDMQQWFLNPLEALVNKGAIVEVLVGQEMLAYSPAHTRANLYYWQRQNRSSQAEVDYLQQFGESIVPIEVKSGPGTTLRSMQLFMQAHPQSPYGIRFSTQNYSLFEQLYSYPLYAVAHVMSRHKPEVKAALKSLL